MKSEIIVEVRELEKYYGKFPVFKNLSLSIKRNTCTGLIGPNGAGKTTLFNCLLGFTGTKQGQIELFSKSISNNSIVNHKILEECRKDIGYVPEENIFYEYLSPREFLEMIASVTRVPQDKQEDRIEGLLDLFKLERWAERTIVTLSEGNRQRLSIATALIQNPKLLLLDEPLNGLDPGGRSTCLDLFSRFIKEEIPELALTGSKTIFISSHLLGDIERICSDVIILNHDGNIVAQGALEDVRNELIENASLEDVYLEVIEDREKE